MNESMGWIFAALCCVVPVMGVMLIGAGLIERKR
jgi:hypothetical protein